MNVYQTRDLGVAAWLVSNGLAVHQFARENKLTVFSFVTTANMEQLVAQYYSSDAKVSPMIFNSAIRTLKTMINRTDVVAPSKSESTYVGRSTRTI